MMIVFNRVRRHIRKIVHSPLMFIWWTLHVSKYKIPVRYRNHYKVIFYNTMAAIGRSPNIINGDDLNNKIKFLLIFDQRYLHVRCADKIAVRNYISKKVGSNYLINLYKSTTRFEDIDFSVLPRRFVIKTNHDSGSVWIISDNRELDLAKLGREINLSLSRRYGWEKGEWFYSLIEPKLLVEEHIGGDGPAEDYKFHCCNGSVKFLQYIYNRKGKNAKEQILDQSGHLLVWSLSQNFQAGSKFTKPPEWSEMIRVAEALSHGFRYVRVDLYLVSGKIYVGELTFAPLCGNYRGEGQKHLGKLITFDREIRREPIVTY